MRECGNCSMCCKLLPIAQRNDGGNNDFPFDKPPGQWCKHCSPGNGCKVFGTPELPSLCRKYECAWLAGRIPDEFKPSRVHAIFDQHEAGGMPYMLITTDPNYPVHPDVRLLIEQNRQIRMVLRTAEGDMMLGAGTPWKKGKKTSPLSWRHASPSITRGKQRGSYQHGSYQHRQSEQRRHRNDGTE